MDTGAYLIDRFIAAIQSGEDIDAKIIMLPLNSYATRVALRAYAYTLIALGDKVSGDAILKAVGKQG